LPSFREVIVSFLVIARVYKIPKRPKINATGAKSSFFHKIPKRQRHPKNAKERRKIDILIPLSIFRFPFTIPIKTLKYFISKKKWPIKEFEPVQNRHGLWYIYKIDGKR